MLPGLKMIGGHEKLFSTVMLFTAREMQQGANRGVPRPGLVLDVIADA